MSTLQELKTEFTTLTGLQANAATIKSVEKYKEIIGTLSLSSKETWELLVNSLKADIEVDNSSNNLNVSTIAIEDVLSIFDEVNHDDVVVEDKQPINLGSDVKVNALSKAKLLEISINNQPFVPLLDELQLLLETYYDSSNKTHRRFIPKSKDNSIVSNDEDDDNNVIRLINWKEVAVTATSNAPGFIQKQLLSDPVTLYRYLHKGCPSIPSKCYSVPSEASLKACRDTIHNTINSIKNRIEKLNTQIDFWISDATKANDIKIYQSKSRSQIRLNRRLLSIFIRLEALFNNLPNKVEDLSLVWPKINRQYMYAIKANFAIVKKLSVVKALTNEITDSKFLVLINELSPQLVNSIIYDTTVLNDNSISFRSADLGTSLDGVISYKVGFTGSAISNEQRLPIVDSSRLIERKKREKSQSTFGKTIPQANYLGKTLGSLLNLPPTLYKTTRNLYWLFDVSYQGLRLNENGDYIKLDNPSGLIAAIRVSKSADYGYFNIGELYVNKHRQLAWRLPKKSLSFLLENLAISLEEVLEGMFKLGLWIKPNKEGELIVPTYSGVVNRSHQRKLKGGQVDLLTDFVLDDLGIKLKRFKNEDNNQGTYVISAIESRHYAYLDSFIKNDDKGIDAFVDRPLTNSRRIMGSIKDEKIEQLKASLLDSGRHYQELDSKIAKSNQLMQEKDKQIKNQSALIKQLEHKLKLAKKK